MKRSATDLYGWGRYECQKCDLCERIARWSHPDGGFRCNLCPRPEIESKAARKIIFSYGDLVHVKKPGRKAFVGKVYSQYINHGPRFERVICVDTPSGAGVGFLARYVTHVKK